jgi:hypothetical protein
MHGEEINQQETQPEGRRGNAGEHEEQHRGAEIEVADDGTLTVHRTIKIPR